MDIICSGLSMSPTLLPGDKIEVEEVAFKALKRGDIIVYDSPENIRINVIHRIVGSDADGLITCGDNNSKIDLYRVRPEHRPLKVSSFRRGSLKSSVSKHGMCVHRYRIVQIKVRNFKDKYLYPIYMLIADSGVLYPIGKLFNTEVRKFKRPKGIELQLFIAKRRIGIFDSEAKKWQISFPWRLFINASE